MNRKWGIRILLAVFAVTILASAVRTASPAPISAIAINEGFVAPSASSPHTELERVNAAHFTGAHAANQRDHIPFHPVNHSNLNDQFVSVENLKIRVSSYLAKDYLFFIYPSHHFW